MMNLDEHPTVRHFREADPAAEEAIGGRVLEASWLRRLASEAGADDAGCIGIGRSELDAQRADILRVFPWAKTLLSFVCRMNRENIRSPARSVANLEFHNTGDEINEVARRMVRVLEQKGIRAINGAMGFPMEADRWPGKMWVVSHKPVAEAAGLGRMGIHRNIIHPRFGNFVLLGTIILDAEIDEESHPIDYNPCLECKLCVAACPVGAIGADGHFDFSACYTHNYREFMGGFTDWVEAIASSANARSYRKKVSDAESVSMWQSLSFGANYKAAYCMAVCPAGDDVIGPFLNDRKRFVKDVVRPLQDKHETVYVIAGSDAEGHVARRFPHKTAKRANNSLRPTSVPAFLKGLPNVFQRGKSKGLNATYHFTFTGGEKIEATIIIRDEKLQVLEGHSGRPDFQLKADSRTWLKFLAKEKYLAWALIRRKIRFKGPPGLLLAFGRCFPA
ncbi:SCP2 sterol-binding domain-containing protein [Methylocaldum sp. RMAD-M]|jgi:NAD-dependent dihydropyrimidine dehydrogenase PreA subunit|uniref:SCP2 sterol-binding domain-containing protein n=1 Tax=Methylocaldum sp. RMAD-M TaxID=2806557 RepID=UPI000A3270A7|nr:SCP2 sterol-binding domain-containing protein [Methylocaldum sp. RMAD-M]MBP1151232.1 NAD-dependent dihydropyrimidine dehydrogenase PreA subunit [Methylocaldum sp. RMAD-M]